MASLELRNGKYRIVFRYGGEKFSRSLKTCEPRVARLALARLEDNLCRLQLGTLTLEPGADIPTVLLSSGSMSRPAKISRVPQLGELLEIYLQSIPTGSLEAGTIRMTRIHIAHLKRLMGERTRLNTIDLELLQKYINKRATEKGLRSRRVSAVTIKKELTTLRAAWAWAHESDFVATQLPAGRRLRYPKTDEKPAFKTWIEIAKIVHRGGLGEQEAKDYWDCVFLTSIEIEQLLQHVREVGRYPCVWPMLATAAYTGARRSELVRAQIADVDLEVGRIVLREKKRVRGQRSLRSVPITPALESILASWLEHHSGGMHLFCDRGVQLTLSQAHKFLVVTLRGTKWEVLPGWHCLRHSFISNCASKGVDQRMIDDWVGHQTDAMRRRYRHLFPMQQMQAIASVFA